MKNCMISHVAKINSDLAKTGYALKVQNFTGSLLLLVKCHVQSKMGNNYFKINLRTTLTLTRLSMPPTSKYIQITNAFHATHNKFKAAY